MKPTSFAGDRPSMVGQMTPASLPALSQIAPTEDASRVPLRHILVGTPTAVRQTIHRLHALHYAETVLWSPIVTTKEQLIITPARGEAMSLLRKYLQVAG